MVLNICAKSFQNGTNPSRVIERTHNTVIQCITLNYSIDELGQTYALHIDSSYITFQTAMIPHTFIFTKIVMRENVKISCRFKNDVLKIKINEENKTSLIKVGHLPTKQRQHRCRHKLLPLTTEVQNTESNHFQSIGSVRNKC